MDESLEREVRRVFGPNADEAVELLGRYGTEAWHREVDRVQRRHRVPRRGDMERVRHFVGLACRDYRDVIMFAEYPPDPEAPRSYAELMDRLGLDPEGA